ncbi:hypothetical protein L3X38_033247 [Prunus dulcis]|uniref:Uncharacterized protein n=1 Tax=Prunus dulcis TaxID=3755 RepID=A0AAD4YWS9_PRUDU|nr:hypothetical protein L3X38_033247 [Prunus dulcis]
MPKKILRVVLMSRLRSGKKGMSRTLIILSGLVVDRCGDDPYDARDVGQDSIGLRSAQGHYISTAGRGYLFESTTKGLGDLVRGDV